MRQPPAAGAGGSSRSTRTTSSSSSSSNQQQHHDPNHHNTNSTTPPVAVGPVQGRLRTLPLFARELIAGGVAGAVSKTCVAPLERVKIILQTHSSGGDGVIGTLRTIWRSEGVPGLFRGNTASVLRVVPYAAIHFGSYEYIRRGIVQLAGAGDSGHGPDAPASLPLYDLLAGSASGAVAVVATYPLDLVRTRLAWETEGSVRPATQQATGSAAAAAAAAAGVSSSGGGRVHAPRPHPHHPTIRSVMRAAIAEEGLVGLYRGVAPTLCGILPYSGLKFYVYQSLKNAYRRWQQRQQAVALQERTQVQHRSTDAPHSRAAVSQRQAHSSDSSSGGNGKPEKLPVLTTLLFGGAAGLLAQTVTFPLDVIRRQMQVSHLQHMQGSDVAPATAASSSSRSSTVPGPGPGQATQQLRQLQTAASVASRHRHHSLGLPQLAAGQAQHRGSVLVQQLRGLFWRAPRPPPGSASAAAAAVEVAPSMADVAVRLWRQRALFRGLSINYIKVLPSTAIGFTLYDGTKAYLGLNT